MPTPPTPSPTDVADSWFTFWTMHKQLSDAAYSDPVAKNHHERSAWLDTWCRHDPDRAWATIVEIWSRVDHADLDMLANLGAGPVEDLLCDWGDEFFPVIEVFCQHEPDFKTVLRMVWQSSMSPQLWQKVQDLRGGPNL